MKTFLFIIIVSAFSLPSFAQVSKVNIQASGLTCSMCSNAINKSLQSLDFVDKVRPNVENSTFVVTFKPESDVNFDQLKKKVEDAGFSVASFAADVQFSNVSIQKNEPVKVGGTTFYFLSPGTSTLNGTQTVKVVDKGFVSPKEYKKYSGISNAGGKDTYHVIL